MRFQVLLSHPPCKPRRNANQSHFFSLLAIPFAAILLSIALFTTGCSTASLRSITVSPAAGTEVLAVGQTFQYKATGYYQQGTHPASSQDITSTVTWTSGNTAVATVSSSGVVTGVSAGSSIITATIGNISGASNVTVTASSSGTGSGGSARVLQSISIYPSSQPTTQIGETTQFIALGSYSGSPVTQDLTNLVTWASSDTFVGKIDATGLETTLARGQTTITALYTPSPSTSNPNPSTIVGTAVVTSDSSNSTVSLPTLTIYKVGPNAALGTVTASYTLSGTTAPINFNCGPNATVANCTVNVPAGAAVTITTPNRTAPPTFGGWSSNCAPALSDPYTCTVTISVPGASGSVGNVTVGAIFD